MGRRGDIGKCNEFNIQGYLSKPVKRLNLIDAIAMVLNPKKEDNSCQLLSPVVTQHKVVEMRSRCKILFVEDNLVNLKLGINLLSNRGHKVSIAGNGKLAISAINREFFDLVFMDIQMPEMNGFETTKEIRRLGYKNLPIIALTANAMKRDIDLCLKAGMNDYLSKPIKPAKLFNMIEKWSKNKPQEEEKIDKNRDENFGEENFLGNNQKKNMLKKNLKEDLIDKEVFDVNEILERVGGSENLLKQVCELFFKSHIYQLENIKQAIDQKDAESLRNFAHCLKGSCASMAAKKLTALAFELECMGESAKMDKSCVVFSKLLHELELFKEKIEHYIL